MIEQNKTETSREATRKYQTNNTRINIISFYLSVSQESLLIKLANQSISSATNYNKIKYLFNRYPQINKYLNEEKS